ncbi:uncharacterized protein F5147DRAFT_648607 [Suillus discolor]|uniref:Uncharacterized protein n=1 Tax=Suillus discolor TaxID=1912936 RepID=A0A9P7JYF3_9AGAM|nr:uncharacterized protein F5147DRAFT_648607 [Suillus discolor]KAG2116989.1 hypothetical protein F5147DRAFT_648607 [Suillus discolor]
MNSLEPSNSTAATKVRATINQGLVPQWNCVRVDDPHMKSHPFFPKTVGYVQPAPALAPAPAPAPEPAPAPALSPVLPPAPKRMSVLPIDALPRAGHAHNLTVTGTMTDKGKQSDRGTRRSRDDSPNAEPGRKKQKVLKCLSKAIISDTEDKDRQPTGTIVVKQRPKIIESSGAAAPKSKGMTKNVKQVRFTTSSLSSHITDLQPEAEANIGRVQPKGKGKEKAVNIAEPVRGRGLLKADAEEVRCNRPVSVDTRRPSTTQAPKSHPRSKAAPASKLKAKSQTTRATSRARPPTPIMESEDTADTEASATSQDDVEMDHDTDAERDTDIAADMSDEPADQIMVDQPGAIASAADFPADHWLEATDDAPIPIPPPTPPADPLSLPSTPTILECVLALTTQVTDMQMADNNALARVNAMEQEFDTRISSMCAELSSMQLDVGATVTLVNGLVCLVEKLRQERVIANPSFPPPMLSHGNESSATAFGMRYMNGVFGPLAAPTSLSAGVGQTSASCPPGRPDTQGDTFTSE